MLKVSVRIDAKFVRMLLNSSWYSFLERLSSFDSCMLNLRLIMFSSSSYQQMVKGFLESLNKLKNLLMLR